MPTYLTFRVELADVDPAPWRVFEIRRTTFMALHEAIQDACGWANYHLFLFENGEGAPIAGLPDDFDEISTPHAATTWLKSYFTEVGTECTYVYDFGDHWVHRVRLMDIRETSARYHRRLLTGELSFPPEDCGGIHGYLECLAIRRGEPVLDMDASERLERKTWLGDWMPDSFDVVTAKRQFDREVD